MRCSSYQRGVLGEVLVAFLLVCSGCSIVAKRYISKLGEIDIIAVTGNRLMFVEVKFTFSTFMDFPFSTRQCCSVLRSAEVFLASNDAYSNYSVSFDLFLLSFCHFEYIPNAWDASVLEC